MRLSIEAACGSNVGRIRKNNEDNCYFAGRVLSQEHGNIDTPFYQRFATSDGICFGVFDGMGGEADGQVASYLAACAFQRDCEDVEGEGMLSETFFANAVIHMNDAVCAESSRRANRMGSTAVMLGFCDDAVYLCNVGDSKCFRYRGKKLTQISIDHLEDIPPFLQQSKRGKPRLSQCIGISSEELRLEPYLATGLVQPEDVFILCSDGLTDMITEEDISLVLDRGRDAGVCVQHLIELALEHGGRDNVTVIAIRISN